VSRKRKKGSRPRRPPPKSRPRRPKPKPAAASRPGFDYGWAIGQADEVLARNKVAVRPDNWQQIALDRAAGTERDRDALARYIEAYEDRLGVAWAREMLRQEVFFQAEDHDAIIAYYDVSLACYPLCALVEMYVAEQIARHGGDWWRARPMLLYAAEHLPDYARPRYELGFLHHLLGDFPGALRWFDRAEALLADEDFGFEASRLYYNRGMVRLMQTGDRDAAIADLKQALHHDPAYAQARANLRTLQRGEVHWAPW
jgi:tetratricopeptide (TPR) repeat protein